MKILILLLSFILVTPWIVFAQQSGATKTDAQLPPAAPLLSPAICGKGTFQFTLGEQPIGREAFEIKCQPDGGYVASGHTELTVPGAAVDLNTTLEVDKTASPISSTAKGTVAGKPFEQSVVVKGNAATLINNGKTQELPFKTGTALLGGNIFYMFQFLLARYDVAAGGAQEIPAFPGLTVKVERVARDRVMDAGVPSKTVALDRYSIIAGLTQIVAWVDEQGRLAVVVVPSQNFGAVREGYAGYTNSLKAVFKSAEVDYSAPPGALFTAEEVTVQAKGFTLAGTLMLPKTGKGPFPAIITITGSGQQTRDEAIPIPGLEKYRPFRQVAERLASQGIAVLRVDDRGVGKSKGIETLESSTSSDFANDVRSQIDYLRSRSDIDPDRIALLGHSEGGVIAPMVAATDPRIKAIVLMAGTAKRGDEIIIYQMNEGIELDTSLKPEEKARKRAEQEETIRKAVASGDLSKLPAPLRSAWMKEFMSYDPLPAVRKVRQPILILQGALDHQVTADQAEMLERAAREAGNKDVTVRVFPNLNHLFLPSKTGAVTEYSSLTTSAIGDEVLNPLSEWLQQKLKVAK